MQTYFLHNHYLPAGLANNKLVKSVIVPELYPDLNMNYLGEPCYFSSASEYIEYVLRHGYFQTDTVFAIENPAVFKLEDIKNQIAVLYSLGVRVCQIYCGKNNAFYTADDGLTIAGKQYLSALSKQGIILDLSHVHNSHIRSVVDNFDGRIIVSHCASSTLYFDRLERSNSLCDESIMQLSQRSTLFGVSFLNDIISVTNNKPQDTQLLSDIIEQILRFVSLVGSENVGLGPDFIDTDYFSKSFGVSLYFPNETFSFLGLNLIAERLREYLSTDDVENIFWRNAVRILH